MSAPGLRTMPVLTATREGSKWVVVAPGGSRIASPSDVVVRERARAIGAAVRFPEVRHG